MELDKVTVWLISVRSGNNRRDFHFSTKEHETPQDTYRRVKSNAEKLQKQVGDKGIAEIISCTVPFKPKGVAPHKSWYWCPYCNKWRVFNHDDRLGVNRCSICGISDQDFYVKKYNNLWRKEMGLNRKIRK